MSRRSPLTMATLVRPCVDPNCPRSMYTLRGAQPHPWHDVRGEEEDAMRGGNAWVDVLNDEIRCANESYDKHLTFALDARLPTSVAGRLETIAAWLEGFPVYAECACGCGELTDTGRREPVITRAQAKRLMEGI